MSVNLRTEKAVFSFVWKIKNFHFSACGKGDNIKSPTFFALPLSETEWNLNLFPKGKENGDYVSCFLHRVGESGPENVTVDFSFALLQKDGSAHLKWTGATQNFRKSSESGWGHTEIWKISDLLKDKKAYFPNGCLTIECQLVFQNNSNILYKCEACTHVEAEKVCFKKSLKILNGINSWIVAIPLQKKFNMSLKMDETEEQMISIEIQQLHKNDEKYVMFGKLTILDSKGLPWNTIKDEHFFGKENDIWQFPTFISIKILREEKNTNVLVNDTLNLLCDFSLSDGEATVDIQESEEANSVRLQREKVTSLNNLSTDLGNLLLDKEFCDVTLRSENKSFPAHKAILSARSPVFKTMFRNEMTESKCGIVEIEDIDADSIEAFLTYIYAGIIDDLEMEKAKKLYVTADKYEVLPLKEKCSELLKKNITSENACEILILGDRHQDKKLKKFSQKFIHGHSAEILVSEEWQQLLEVDVALATEMMRMLSLKIF